MKSGICGAAALCLPLSTAIPANAASLFNGGYPAASWSTSTNDGASLGFNATSVTQVSPRALDFSYNYGIYPGPGIDPGAGVIFSTVAQSTGNMAFKASYSSLMGYFDSYNNVYVFTDGPGGVVESFLGQYGFATSGSVDVKEGYSWGFRTEFGNYDYNSTALGTLSVVGVPEPASWLMLIAGFGLVGASLRRRRVRSVAA